MYVGWIFLIVFACILPPSLTLGIVSYKKYSAADTAYSIIQRDYYYNGDKEKELERLNKITNSKSWVSGISFIVAMIVGLGLLVCLLVCPIEYCTAKDKYATFIETQELVRVVYDGEYNEYENAGLNTKVVELNKWLAEARASKKNWGICSAYYSFDLDSLDYIKLVKGESKT